MESRAGIGRKPLDNAFLVTQFLGDHRPFGDDDSSCSVAEERPPRQLFLSMSVTWGPTSLVIPVRPSFSSLEYALPFGLGPFRQLPRCLSVPPVLNMSKYGRESGLDPSVCVFTSGRCNAASLLSILRDIGSSDPARERVVTAAAGTCEFVVKLQG